MRTNVELKMYLSIKDHSPPLPSIPFLKENFILLKLSFRDCTIKSGGLKSHTFSDQQFLKLFHFQIFQDNVIRTEIRDRRESVS